MRTRLLLIGCLGLLLLTVAVQAQDTQSKKLLKSGIEMESCHDWAGAATIWAQVLAYAEWPFAETREQVTVRRLYCLRRTGKEELFNKFAQKVLTEHPADNLGTATRALITASACADAVKGTAQINALMEDKSTDVEKLTQLSQAAIAELGDADPVLRAWQSWRTANFTHPQAWMAQLVLLQLRDRLGDPCGAMEEARALDTSTAGPKTDARIQFQIQLFAKCGELPEAYKLLQRAYPTGKMAPEQLLKISESAPKWDAFVAQCPKTVQCLLDDPLSTPRDDEYNLRNLAASMPGAVYQIDRALTAYLATRPTHPRRTTILLAQVRLLKDAGDVATAIKRAESATDELTGTADELDLVRLNGDLFLQCRNANAATASLAIAASYHPENKDLQEQSLQACMTAEDTVHGATVVTRQLKAQKTPSIETLQASYWLFIRAVNSGDKATATKWSATLTEIAPESALAGMARRKIRELGWG